MQYLLSVFVLSLLEGLSRFTGSLVCSLQKNFQAFQKILLFSRFLWAQLKSWSNTALMWTRETREGWPLLTVESEANGDSRSTGTHIKGVLQNLFVGHVMPVQEFFLLPWMRLSAQYKIFFLHCTLPFSINFSPSPRKLDRQLCRVEYVSL